MLEFMLGFHNRRRASLLPKYLMIVMVPLFAWAQDSPSREQAIGPMQVQKKTERFSNGRPKTEYSSYRGKDGQEVLHGKYLTWLENGKKELSCNYVNGEKEGVCLWWDDLGRQADSVEYIHGKPRAIAEWEARDQRAVKTPIYLYPYILVLPNGGLTFSSAYAGITKEFPVSQMKEVFASLPASVWVDGKSIGIQQVGLASEADHQTMDQVTGKVKAFFTGKGYRTYGLPQ
jgi:hypothetical protein